MKLLSEALRRFILQWCAAFKEKEETLLIIKPLWNDLNYDFCFFFRFRGYLRRNIIATLLEQSLLSVNI